MINNNETQKCMLYFSSYSMALRRRQLEAVSILLKDNSLFITGVPSRSVGDRQVE